MTCICGNRGLAIVSVEREDGSTDTIESCNEQLAALEVLERNGKLRITKTNLL